MKAKSYQEKLKDPRWQKKRLHVLESAGWKCEDCGASDLPLHVHHCAYIRGFEPWEYDDDLLMSLCEKHHEERQKMEDGFRVAIGRITRRMKPLKLDDEVWAVIQASQVISDCAKANLALRLDGDAIRWCGRRPSPDLLERMRMHKPGISALLEGIST